MLQLDYKQYRTIPGFHNYMISEYGEIYSIPRKKIIAQYINHNGYLVSTITDDTGYRAPRRINRLVYMTYIGPINPEKHVDHIDDNPLNNHYSNLQELSGPENSRKSFISGKNKNKVVWSKSIIHEMCKMIEMNIPEEEIFETLGFDYNSNRYNCNHLIGDLRRGKIHTDVTSQYDLSKYIPAVNKKDAKLSIDQVKSIYIQALFDDLTIVDIAKNYKVTCSTIQKIRDKKTWKQVTDQIDDQLGMDRKELSSTTIPWIVYNFKQSIGVRPEANAGG